jgi:thiol-disulfide isomerase/thioredoxin
MKRLLAVFTLTLTIALVSHAQDKLAKAPTVELKDIRGKTVKLSDFKGRVVLVNFWATWCVPCRAEIPQLVAWSDQYKTSLQIVGITYPPTSLAKVRAFVRGNNIRYPVLIGTRATKHLFEPSENLPITIIVDPKGNIAGRIDGVIFSDEFDSKIRPLLPSK